MNTVSQIKWLAVVIGAIGVWLIVGPPFLFEAPFADFWNDLLVGTALVALAAYTYAKSGAGSSRWSAAAAMVFGVWLVVGAVLWSTSAFLHWNDVAAGVGVALVAGYSAYGAHTEYASGDGSGGDADDSNGNDSDGDSENLNGDSAGDSK